MGIVESRPGVAAPPCPIPFLGLDVPDQPIPYYKGKQPPPGTKDQDFPPTTYTKESPVIPRIGEYLEFSPMGSEYHRIQEYFYQKRFGQYVQEEDICEWITKEPLFVQWLAASSTPSAPSRSSGLLWVSGKVGTGKTYLAARVVRHLVELFPPSSSSSSGVSICYYFLNVGTCLSRETNGVRPLRQVLYALACRLSMNNSAYEEYLASRLGSSSFAATDLRSAWKVLFADFFSPPPGSRHRHAARASGTVFMVLDSLDCADVSERRLLFELAGGLLAQPGCRLKILMFGRPHVVGEIRASMGLREVPTITVTPEKTAVDMERYIRHRVHHANKWPAVGRELVEAHLRVIDGRFSLIDPSLDSFQFCCSKNELIMRRILENLPDRLVKHQNNAEEHEKIYGRTSDLRFYPGNGY